MLQHVWDNLSERKRDLICNVLDKYCVPYKVTTNRSEGIFGYSENYSVIVNLSVEERNGVSPRDFVLGKVQERLDLEQSLSLDFKPTETIKLNKGADKSKDELSNKVSPLSRIVDFLASGFEKKETISDEAACKIMKDIEQFFESNLQPSLGQVPDVISDIISSEGEGDVVSFDSLPSEVKAQLISKIPEDILRSDSCKISLKTRNGITQVSVTIVRGSND